MITAPQTVFSLPKPQAAVRVLCAPAAIAGCRDAWTAFQRHPNVDWDFYWHINQVSRQEPCLLELRQGDQVRSLWVGRLERGRVPLRLGYLKLGGLRLGRLNIITGGFMGDDSAEACHMLLQRATESLPELGVDTLVLSYVPRQHPLFELATHGPNWLCRDWGVISTQHWRMKLPASFDDFLKSRSKKHRYWLKRLPRVLEEAYPGQVRIRSFETVDEVEAFCQDADTVGKTTYQHQLGEAFRADADYRTRCRLLAKKNALRGLILYIADQPKAYWMATVCQEVLYLNLTGYCPELRKFELGTILLMKLFEEHCGTAVRQVDFGHGGALYKERFGEECFEEATVRVYRLGPRGMLANAVTASNAKLSRGVAAVLSKLGLLQKIKTLWRGKLTSEASAGAK